MLALAVVDDLAGIMIIAVFFTSFLSFYALTVAGMALAGLVILNRTGVTKGAPYIILSLILWASVLKSGVHATLAGVALGFAIPLAPGKDGSSLLQDYEHALHPWVAIKAGLAIKPDSITYHKLYGASLLAGIGFTMSLFIGGLAFEDVEHQNLVRLGVLVGSLMSGVLGAFVLAYSAIPAPISVSEA
ncbi:MAG: Na+/H+ antiporter NhaA [Amylibacter sp.]